MATRRRRLPLTAASGSAQITYHGNSHAVERSSARVLQPAATRQSAPRAVRRRANSRTSTNASRNSRRHHSGVPLSPTRRAVSAGMLCVATSCCCSETALRKPNAWTPKPTTPSSASASSQRAVPRTAFSRSRFPRAAAIMNGSASPAVTLTPTPAASTPHAACTRGFVPAVSTSAAPRNIITSVSLCAPPTAITSRTGFSPTKTAAHRGETPSRPAARAISQIPARLPATVIVFNAHRPAATPSGATA